MDLIIFSVPEVVVHDPTGSGTGAKLRAVTSNEGKITDIKIINAGIGYSTSSTIEITASGKNQKFDSSIRSLSVNQVEKLSTQQTEILKDINGELSYSVTGYFDTLRNSFQDDGSEPSGIIGWAYDGNPIYGSYSISDPENTSSGIKTMTSSYVQSASNIYDRPSISDFPLGFFVEDYRYVNGTGDLDKNNGRFTKTKEFPNGVYAYYASINPVSGKPVFPYFIGDTFRSNTLSENSTLDQTFDFNSSGLSRNTLPYKISELEADNDFIIESNEIKRQKISVESVQEGSVTSVKITNAGDNYKVGDSLTFDNSNTNGGGISAEISELKGKTINKIDTEYQSYNNALFTWRNDGKVRVTIEPFHIFSDNDYVSISGFSTSILSSLNGYFKIDVPSIATIGITTEIAGTGAATTEIYVTQIPSGISVGSTIGIGTETLEVLNLYSDKNIFRVKRGLPNTTHTVGVAITAKSNTFIIDQKLDYFESKVNDKVYFNPRESVGLGTTAGRGYQVSYSFGQETITGSIPTQRISLDDHPFQTNQKLAFSANGNSAILISTSPTGTPFNLEGDVYAVNKSPSTIGIKTSLTSDEVFFITNGSDADDYYFESNFEQKTGIVEKILSTVSISTAHGLTAGDSIALNVKPNLSVGIGTSTAVRVNRSFSGNIQINPIGFNSTGVSTVTNEITISNHELETGDKVHYEDDTFGYLVSANDESSVLSPQSYPTGLYFKPDGTQMYTSGDSSYAGGLTAVVAWDLSTPWSPSTATFSNFYATDKDNTNGLYFRDDGRKFWVAGWNNGLGVVKEYLQYSMSTPWDVSTASYDNISLNPGSLGLISSVSNPLNPMGIYFRYDGKVAYVSGIRNLVTQEFLYQLDLSTPWDISTASYSGVSLTIGFNPGRSEIHINSSGNLLYFTSATGGDYKIHIYRLSTPWDISTGVEIDTFSGDFSATNTPNALYVTEDEVDFYTSANTIVERYQRPSPLDGSNYFIYKVDQNTVKLCNTPKDANLNPPTVVSFASTGSSSQTLSPINPRIESIVNNNLVFDLSDSSLSGYAFRVYYDQDFNNEFVSTGSTSTFSSVGVGTTGLSGATYTLNHSSGFPEKLYYSLEKSGYISTSDKEVDNYSEILFVDSVYNQTYPISGVGTTTFQVSLQEAPEKLSYLSTECDKLEYTTTSTSASGPANKVKLLSGGSEYKKLPVLSDVTSTNGDNLFVSLESNDIGNVLETRIINEGFEYSSDKTLQPEAFISPKIQLKNSNTIGIVTITSGGSGYITTPEIVVVNNDTRTVLSNGLIKPILTGNSITNLNIEVPPKGISDQSAELFAISNTNGVSITKVDSSNTGIFTCTLTTPSLGFTTTPFAVNDEVFVEGIQKYSTSGDGFNSSDYGYKFFTVTNYNVGLVEDKVTLSIVGLGTNTGIAKTIQDSFGTIVSKDNYPTFSISLRSSAFEIGETLIVDDVERDLVVYWI